MGAQQTADSDEQTAAADLSAAQKVCGGSHSNPEVTSGHSTTGGTTSTSSTAETTSTKPATPPKTKSKTRSTTTPTTTAGGSTACTTALSQALADQQQVAADQKAVGGAESSLAKLLASEASSATTTTSQPSGSSSPSSSHASSSGSGSGASAATDSAAQLATDQADIDTDQASLIDAQQSLSNTQLTSPITGSVVAVGITAGQSVTAGSTSDVITVIDHDSYEATASLSTGQVTKVKVGDAAAVNVDGQSETLTGVVTRVGPVDTSGSSGDTYPLVVALPAGSHGIFAGSTAQIEVVLSQVHDALAVPTSAVHTVSAGTSYVLVLQSGQEVRKTVRVGVVGGVYSQITSGLRSGAVVVLADLTEAIPTSSTNTFVSRFGPGGFTSFPGGGSGSFFRSTAGFKG
ncbi:MAG: efflux RND transporter periplasmic adaptor subunit [Acidimicrobiales bacterium]